MAKAKKTPKNRTSAWVGKDTLTALHQIAGHDDTVDTVIQGLIKFLRVNDGVLPDGRAKVPSWRAYVKQPAAAADWRTAVPKK